MAKKAYVGINNLSKNGTQLYIGVGNLSKKVVKGYIGVNNQSRLFWELAEETDGFWFFFETIAKKLMEYRRIDEGTPLSQKDNIYKLNTGIAFYCVALDGVGGACVFTFSTDSTAIDYEDRIGSETNLPTTGSVTLNNDTWNYAYIDLRPSESLTELSPNCAITEPTFVGATPANIITWILNNRIYTSDFVEDYQARQTYNAVFGDRRKTLRKAIAIWLYKNYSFKGYGAYDILLENIDTIIDELLALIENDDKIQVSFSNVVMSSSSRISIQIDSTDGSLSTFRPNSKSQLGGYVYLQNSNYLQTTRYTYAIIESTSVPPIRYFTSASSGNINTVGTRIINPSQYRVDHGVIISNLGLNF